MCSYTPPDVTTDRLLADHFNPTECKKFTEKIEKMADSELDEIRAKRMAELQQQLGGGAAGGGGGGQDPQRQAEMKQQQDDMKNSILSQVLDQRARARLNTIALAKPEKAKMVENMLVQMTQTGQIQSKLGEEQLKSLLERVSEQTTKTTTVKFDRRRAALDDSDDDYA